MINGTVKFYNEAKGFGFLIEDNTNQEVFVHMSGLIDSIKEGDKVTYDITQGKKGPNAVNVKIAS